MQKGHFGRHDLRATGRSDVGVSAFWLLEANRLPTGHKLIQTHCIASMLSFMLLLLHPMTGLSVQLALPATVRVLLAMLPLAAIEWFASGGASLELWILFGLILVYGGLLYPASLIARDTRYREMNFKPRLAAVQISVSPHLFMVLASLKL